MLARTVAELAVLIARRILVGRAAPRPVRARSPPSSPGCARPPARRSSTSSSTRSSWTRSRRVWVARHGSRHRGFTLVVQRATRRCRPTAAACARSTASSRRASRTSCPRWPPRSTPRSRATSARPSGRPPPARRASRPPTGPAASRVSRHGDGGRAARPRRPRTPPRPRRAPLRRRGPDPAPRPRRHRPRRARVASASTASRAGRRSRASSSIRLRRGGRGRGMSRPHPPLLGHLRRAVSGATTIHATGSVTRVVGNTIEAAGLTVRLGSICWVDLEGETPVLGGGRRLPRPADHARPVRRHRRRAAGLARAPPRAAVPGAGRPRRPRPRARRLRPPDRRQGPAPRRRPRDGPVHPGPARPRPDHRHAVDGRPRDRRPAHHGHRPADGHLRGLRRGQVHAPRA